MLGVSWYSLALWALTMRKRAAQRVIRCPDNGFCGLEQAVEMIRLEGPCTIIKAQPSRIRHPTLKTAVIDA